MVFFPWYFFEWWMLSWATARFTMDEVQNFSSPPLFISSFACTNYTQGRHICLWHKRSIFNESLSWISGSEDTARIYYQWKMNNWQLKLLCVLLVFASMVSRRQWLLLCNFNFVCGMAICKREWYKRRNRRYPIISAFRAIFRTRAIFNLLLCPIIKRLCPQRQSLFLQSLPPFWISHVHVCCFDWPFFV